MMKSTLNAVVFMACIATNSIANEAIKLTTNANSPTQSSQQTLIAPSVAPQSVKDWLAHLQGVAKPCAYSGTFVVSVGVEMATAKILHTCDGDQEMERVETLTGVPRLIYRRNSDVVTFFPSAKLVRKEQRESLGLFPNFSNANTALMGTFYDLKVLKPERVAGFAADVVLLAAKDHFRHSYRIWTERKTGLVVKLQTLDVVGRVVEQAAFSELNLDAPVKMARLSRLMVETAGNKIEQVSLIKTTPISQGWMLAKDVSGFASVACYQRVVRITDASADKHGHKDDSSNKGNETSTALQWMFSDGLANVSLFVEPYDKKRHVQEGMLTQGATNTLTKHKNGWWFTAVGEVPFYALKSFVQNMERTR